MIKKTTSLFIKNEILIEGKEFKIEELKILLNSTFG